MKKKTDEQKILEESIVSMHTDLCVSRYKQIHNSCNTILSLMSESKKKLAMPFIDNITGNARALQIESVLECSKRFKN